MWFSMVANFSISDVRDRFQQLSVREQWLVIVVLGAAIYFLIDALVFVSQKQRGQNIDNELQVLQSQMVVLGAEMKVVERTRADELEQKERELRRLKQQVAQLDAVVGSVSAEAPRIGKLVGDVLGAAPVRVRVVGIKTLPVKTLFAPKASAPGASSPAQSMVYKHGLDIELRGNYLDLLKYINQLEETHSKLFWSNAAITAGVYPDNTLRATVFMLSTQPNL
jgi:MSHA biogenesis protein MshJ